MKILIVNVSDNYGGAARAAYRQHLGLIRSGVNSTMIVQEKKKLDLTILGPNTLWEKFIGTIKPHIDQLPLTLLNPDKNIYFSPSWYSFNDIVKKIKLINPDIIHLHWVCKGMLNIEELAKINIPLVWTLHDAWAFTGGCHTIPSCQKYLTTCGSCPALKSDKPKDLSYKLFKRKMKAYTKIKSIEIIAVSNWLGNMAKKSTLLSNFSIRTLPNQIDTEVFKPIDRNLAKNILNLNSGKKVLLFGAMSALEDDNKGFKEFLEALSILNIDPSELEVLIFGASRPIKDLNSKYNFSYLGYLQDEISMAIVYSAADLMVVPSKQESFGQTASEAMSCGIPVVAFATSGLLDIVDHKKTGYLAAPFSVSDLAAGIEWVINNKNLINFSANSRNKVLQNFDSRVVTQKYLSLYRDMLYKEKSLEQSF